MIVLAIIATIIAIGVSFLVVMANGMSDAPMAGFQGGYTIAIAWGVAGVFWLAWGVG